MTPQSLGFTAAEAAILQAGTDAPTPLAGSACLRSYGGDIAPSDTYRLMVYHVRAAIDLGLTDHAKRLFAGLIELLDSHPELACLEPRSPRDGAGRGLDWREGQAEQGPRDAAHRRCPSPIGNKPPIALMNGSPAPPPA